MTRLRSRQSSAGAHDQHERRRVPPGRQGGYSSKSCRVWAALLSSQKKRRRSAALGPPPPTRPGGQDPARREGLTLLIHCATRCYVPARDGNQRQNGQRPALEGRPAAVERPVLGCPTRGKGNNFLETGGHLRGLSPAHFGTSSPATLPLHGAGLPAVRPTPGQVSGVATALTALRRQDPVSSTAGSRTASLANGRIRKCTSAPKRIAGTMSALPV